MRSPHTSTKSSPRSPQLEKARAATKTQHNKKKKKKLLLHISVLEHHAGILILYYCRDAIRVKNKSGH